MQVIWTEKANETFNQITTYIREKFSKKEVDDFVLQTMEVLEVLKTHPTIYPVSKIRAYKSVRKAVIHPNSSLYYRISNKHTITLVTFWDNRWNDSEKD